MAKPKIEIDNNVRRQFTSSQRIVRELMGYSKPQRDRILQIVQEANYDLPQKEEAPAQTDAFDAPQT